ncbi:hypothetical protein VW23_000470 [Devosia insulae DS-56]|uniref:histidine kinase n=1 Tax=Devosia insulae DS-56 TaxID=1116389 RepID=A0A1E5XHN7_9HYPH|nr:ATP-binding protein [Devosia insulae]OEO28102.1 hypothetical protein VW23_000470 [Devosia insulae DS-56]
MSERNSPLAQSGSDGQGIPGLVHDLGNYIQIAASAIQIMSRETGIATSLTVGKVLPHAADALERAAELIRRSRSVDDDEAADDLVDLELCLAQMGPLLSYAGGPDVRLKLLVGVVPRVRCGALALQNALLNLTLNARDAMPGGGTLSLTALTADGPETAEVEITVRDTGIGMAAEILERATDPHFSTKPDGVGHGMGLAGVKRFVERAGGRLFIRSAPYAGTTVTLRLPAAV